MVKKTYTDLDVEEIMKWVEGDGRLIHKYPPFLFLYLNLINMNYFLI